MLLLHHTLELVLLELAGVEVENMVSDHLVVLPSSFILHDEDAIETTKNGGLEFDLIGDGLAFLVATEDGVGCCQNRTFCVEAGGDTCLRNRDCLLLHSLVHYHSVLRAHLIKLIDTAHTPTSEYKCSSFQCELIRSSSLID